MHPIYRHTSIVEQKQGLQKYQVCEFAYRENKTKCLKYYYSDDKPENGYFVKSKDWEKAKESNYILWTREANEIKGTRDYLSAGDGVCGEYSPYKSEWTTSFSIDENDYKESFLKEPLDAFEQSYREGYNTTHRFSNRNIHALNSRLKSALKIEDYEQAAILRDKIKELESK